MSPSPAVAAVRAHLEAEDRGDAGRAMEPFADDCWYAIPAQGVRLDGKEAVRAHHERLLAAFPDLRNVVHGLHDAGDRVFARLSVERTHRGDWGGVAATGRRLTTSALAEFVIAADGRLEAEVVHANPLEALHQLGAAPTANAFELAAAWRRLAGETGR
jgi:steroid delta-isomerase-like uncharacterized protein